MARQAKPLTEYFRVMLAAACLADELKVPRTGWGLARWFEVDQQLQKHSVDEKSWRRFLDGHKPHQIRLQKIFVAAPLAKSLFDHPFWMALSLSCTRDESVQVLESFNWTSDQKNKLRFEGGSELSILDRIACLLAMLNCGNAPYNNREIGRRLCVEYVDICSDRLWSDYSDNLLLLIRMKMQNTAEELYGLSEMEVLSAFKFWRLIKEDFFKNESVASARAWVEWREAVHTLTWQDQVRFTAFINNRNMLSQLQIYDSDRRVYRKVRARMYRALNKLLK